MKIVRTVEDLRRGVAAWHKRDLKVAVVPTMGGLHAGHVSLVRHGLSHADRVVATLFVNPTQFGATEDLSKYPRDEARDAAMLDEAGCAMLFAPALDEMYPPGFSTRVIVDDLTDCLCGAARPGHFDGVAQVVTKLLNQAQADLAVFGQKDWQQLAIVTRMARDLDIPTRIIGAPTIRETDGLAMSSRNQYLTPEERQIAPVLFQALTQMADDMKAGADGKTASATAAKTLLAAGFAEVDYLDVRTAEGLAPVTRLDPDLPARVFGAAHLGRARLIDNLAIAP